MQNIWLFLTLEVKGRGGKILFNAHILSLVLPNEEWKTTVLSKVGRFARTKCDFAKKNILKYLNLKIALRFWIFFVRVRMILRRQSRKDRQWATEDNARCGFLLPLTTDCGGRRRKKKEEEPQNPEIFTSPHLLPSFNRQATNTPSSLPWCSEWKVWNSTDGKYFYFFLRKWEPSVNQVGINIRIYISSGFVANPTPPFPTNQPEYSSSSLSLNSGKILAGGRGKERGGGGKIEKSLFMFPSPPFLLPLFVRAYMGENVFRWC